MPITKRIVTVAAELSHVRSYFADFSNAADWDPGTVRCPRRGSGEIEVGAEWDNVTKFLGRESKIRYRLEHFGPERVMLVGKNKTVTSIDDIALRAVPGGTEITYISDVTFHGFAKLADPLTLPIFHKLGNETAANLERILGSVAR